MAHKNRPLPMRSCVICHQKADKRTLTRIVKTPQGIALDTTGKMNGRGAYLCADPQCWQRATQTNALAKALRTNLTPSDYDTLQRATP